MSTGGLALPEACPDEAASAQRMSVPFAPQSVIVVRERVTGWMRGLGCAAEPIEDVRLVVSELVGNAVRHGAGLSGRMLEVSWLLSDDAVVICVADGGAGLPERPALGFVPADATEGRGLAIVDALSTRWWTRSADGVHAVHAQIPLT